MDYPDEELRLLMGERIRKLRHDKGWTGEEASKRIVVGRGRWQNWECGTRGLTIDTLPKVRKLFNTTYDYLFLETDDPRNQSGPTGYTIASGTGHDVGSQNRISDSVAFRTKVLEAKGIEGHKIVLLSVPDNSMAPDLSKGDEVLIDLTETDVKEPDIYAIREQDGNIWLRWIRKDIGGTYTLYANDKTHSNDQQLTEDQFNALDVLGRYVWSGRWRK
tara:strand:- start:12172 stop:12825 length:654 start_codon:yes stop_codon:yes gene_type:complete